MYEQGRQRAATVTAAMPHTQTCVSAYTIAVKEVVLGIIYYFSYS